jgi:hypothetical protein
MTKYKCGHECDTIFANSNPFMILQWVCWKDTVGFDGDKSMCWDCFCKEKRGDKNE